MRSTDLGGLGRALDARDRPLDTRMSPLESRHHPMFDRIETAPVADTEEYFVDFLGIVTRKRYLEGLLDLPHVKAAVGYIAAGRAEAGRELPVFDEEYFEWIDVLWAVQQAEERFTMIELGAGYGRWCVRAVRILEQLNQLPYTLVAVEPEPTHFEWLHEHFRENGIDPTQHRLVEAAISDRSGSAKFAVGNPSGWYGQSIVDAPSRRGHLTRHAKRVARRALGSLRLLPPIPSPADQATTKQVPSVTLTELLDPLPVVDLIDLDVQGAEADVLACAAERLDAQVKRVHIGTHGRHIESRLRELFTRLEWDLCADYGSDRVYATPYGEIAFQDGVQSWVNPKLAVGTS